MSIENPPIKQLNHDHFLMQETNRMQIDLMRRSSLGKEEWIKKYGRKFREIVEDSALNKILLELYSEDPLLAEDYIESGLRELKLSDRN